MKNLQNKNIIIFGATSYIGHELSTILAKKGVNQTECSRQKR